MCQKKSFWTHSNDWNPTNWNIFGGLIKDSKHSGWTGTVLLYNFGQSACGCIFWNVYGSRDRFSAYPFKHCMPEHLEALCGGLVLVCNPSSSMGRVTRNKSYMEYPADCPSWEHGWEPAYPGWTGTHPNHFSQPVWGASVWDAHPGTRIWPIPAAFDPKEKWQSTAAREQKGPIGGHNNLVLICEGWLVSAISVDHVSTGFEQQQWVLKKRVVGQSYQDPKSWMVSYSKNDPRLVGA